MKAKNLSQRLPNDLQPLSSDDQSQMKGGLLITCEEKRHKSHGVIYITITYKYNDDHSSVITYKMS